MTVLNSFLSQFVVYAASPGWPLDSNGFNDIIGWLVGISTGLAVVGASICLIRIMVADDPSQISDAKTDLKQVLIAWVAIGCLGAIVHTAFSLIGTMNF